jgi:hypothetical protein
MGIRLQRVDDTIDRLIIRYKGDAFHCPAAFGTEHRDFLNLADHGRSISKLEILYRVAFAPLFYIRPYK